MAVATGAPALAVADGLHALGAVVPVDGRISWFARGARGFAPHVCYLASEPDGAVLVDTGLPVHEQIVLEQLAAQQPTERPLTLVLRRPPESDSVGNAGLILTRFPAQRLVSVWDAEPWVYFRHDSGAVPTELRDAAHRPAWVPIERGMRLAVGSGGRELLVAPAPLRLLPAVWLHDAASGTLLTSDAFGHTLLERPDDPWIVDTATDTTTYEQVRSQLLAKFEWVASAHTAALREQVAEVFESLEIETVAPDFGCILRGRSVVQRHLGFVLRALAEVGAS